MNSGTVNRLDSAVIKAIKLHSVIHKDHRIFKSLA